MRQNVVPLLLLASVSCAASSSSCPPLGQVYPGPKAGLTSDAQLKTTWSNLTASLDFIMQGSQTNATTVGDAFLSVGVASVHEKNPLFEYYRTPKEVNTTGATDVNEDTIFCLGSITKVFTVLALILHEDKFSWDDPITKYVPELRSLHACANGSASLPIKVEWDQVTLRALSSQLAGIPRDSTLFNGPAPRNRMADKLN